MATSNLDVEQLIHELGASLTRFQRVAFEEAARTALAAANCTGIGQAFPSFPIRFSLGLVVVSMAVSILTGLFSGFAPAWTASRLDPVAALRYE